MDYPFKIVNGTEVKIISLEQFRKIVDKNCVVVITCLSFDEILEQLDVIEQFDGTLFSPWSDVPILAFHTQ